jgi:hypothetical protein
MTRRKGIARELALAALVSIGSTSACSKPAIVEPARIAEASPAEQARIRDAERELDRARDGLGRAEVAKAEADEFVRTVTEEQKRADSYYSAASRSAEVSQGTRDANLATSIERRQDTARLESEEFDAKARFAEALVELREKEQALAEADVELQETLLERAKFDAAEQAGDAEGLERADFVDAEEDARVRFGEAQREVARARLRSDESQRAWLLARNRTLESAPR